MTLRRLVVLCLALAAAAGGAAYFAGTVGAVDPPVTASFDYSPSNPLTGEEVTFTSNSSVTGIGNLIVTEEWDFDNNGTFDANGSTARHTFNTSGDKTVVLHVVDALGNEDTTSRVVSVGDRSPTASISATPNPAMVNAQVTFNASGSSDPDGSIVRYEWDLDGNAGNGFETDTSANSSTTQTYGAPGTADVRVRVSDNAGNQDIATVRLTVEAGPTASFTINPNPADTGQTVDFNGSGSSDPDGSITRYEWDLDGSTGNGFEVDSGSSPTTSRSYTTGGARTVRLRITDNNGHQATTSHTLTVNDRLPTASFTVSPNPASTGQTVNFDGSASSDPEGAIAKYEWDLDGNAGNGFERDSGTDATVSQSYATSGPRTVRLRVTDAAGGQHTTSRDLTVNDRGPTAAITASPNPAMVNQQVNFDASGSSDPDGSITKYEWDLDGTPGFEFDSGTDPTVSQTYGAPGSANVRVRVTDNGGNQSEAGVLLRVEAGPSASFTIDPNPADTGQSVNFDGSASSDPDGTIAKYEWDLDGSTSNGFELDSGTDPTVSRTYTTGGARNLRLRVTDNNGHQATTSRILTVNDRPPVASFTVSPNPAVTGQTVNFDGSGSSDAEGSITKYEWDLDGNGSFERDSGTDPTVSQSYATSGPRTVRLRVTDSAGGTNTTSRDLAINDRGPTAAITAAPNPAMVSQLVSFDASGSSDPDGSIVRYEWDLDGTPGNGFETDTGTNPRTSQTYGAPGTANVRVQVTDNAGNSSVATVVLRVEAGPSASFTVDPNPADTGQTVNFDGSGSSDPDGTIAKYEWDLDGSSSTGSGGYELDSGTDPTVSRSYTTGGARTVRLRVTDNNSHQATTSRILTVNDRPPTASFTASPNPATTGQTVNFNGSGSSDPEGSITKYEWDLDGNSGTGTDGFERDSGTTATVSQSYATSGPRTVRLRVTDSAGNRNATERTLNITDRGPTASFTISPNPVATSETVILNGSASSDPDGSIVRYQWDLDGNAGNGFEFDSGGTSTIGHSYTTSGTRTVRLRVTDNVGNQADTQHSLTVTDRAPSASFSVSPNPAQTGQTVNFDGSASSDPDGSIVRYQWDLDGNAGNGFEVDSGASPTTSRSYATGGGRTVRLRVTDNAGNQADSQQSISITNQAPTAAFGYSPASPLTNQQITFTSTSTDPEGLTLTHNWDLDGDTLFDDATGSQVNKSFPQPGTYTIGLRVTDPDGASHTTSTSVTVGNRAPTASFTHSPTSPLSSEIINLTSSSSDPEGTTLVQQWDLNNDGIYGDATGELADVSFPTPGTYTIGLRVTDGHGASAVVSRDIAVQNRAPIAEFRIVPSTAATGELVTFDSAASRDSDGTIVKYEWDLDGNGSFERTEFDSQAERAYAPPARQITIRLRVTDSNGATATATNTLTINDRFPGAVFDMSPNPALTGEVVTFNGSQSRDPDGTIVSYEWDLDGNTSTGTGGFETPMGANPIVTKSYPTAGSVRIRLRVTDNAGNQSVSTTSTLVINDRPPVASFTITPNPAATGQLVSFDATTSTDPDGTIVNYEWDLDGNGSFETDTNANPTTTHTYQTAGTFTIKLRITDNANNRNTTTRDVVVTNRGPTASFTTTPNPVLVGQPATFDASASRDAEPTGSITLYEWDLNGDGLYEPGSTIPVASNTYTAFGPVTIKLRVTDNDGATAETTSVLNVQAPPVAAFTMSPNPALISDPVTFNASGSSDPDGGLITRYEWDLNGDNTFEVSGTSPTTTKTYGTAGPVNVQLRVTDTDGNQTVKAETLTINSRPVNASFAYAPDTPLTHQAITFRSNSSATGSNNRIVSHKWDLDGNGSFEVDRGADPTATRAYQNPRNVTVRLEVKDAFGNVGIASEEVTIGNRAPSASFTYLPTAPVSGAAIRLVSTSSDSDGQLVSQSWDLNGDGSFGDAGGGSAERFFAQPGNYNISLRIVDDVGAVAFQSQTIAVKAPPPAPVNTNRGPSLLNPFPVVRIAGTLTGSGVRLRRLTIGNVPTDATVTVRCSGRRCPTRRLSRVAKAKPGARNSGVMRFRRFERRLLAAGLRVEVFVTKPNVIGKYTRFKIRKGKPPARVDRCLNPGEMKPVACPAF